MDHKRALEGTRTTQGVIKQSFSEKCFAVFNYTFFIVMGLTTLLPFVNLIAKSLSSEGAVISGRVGLFPVGVQFETYKYVLQDSMFLNSLKVSIFLTVIGTACSCF